MDESISTSFDFWESVRRRSREELEFFILDWKSLNCDISFKPNGGFAVSLSVTSVRACDASATFGELELSQPHDCFDASVKPFIWSGLGLKPTTSFDLR